MNRQAFDAQCLVQVVWAGGSWAAQHAELAHWQPRAWLGGIGEEPSLFWQEPVARRVAEGVKHQAEPAFCKVSGGGAIFCIPCAGTDQAGQDQASVRGHPKPMRMGRVPSAPTSP